jgi:hypothetical protein
MLGGGQTSVTNVDEGLPTCYTMRTTTLVKAAVGSRENYITLASSGVGRPHRPPSIPWPKPPPVITADAKAVTNGAAMHGKSPFWMPSRHSQRPWHIPRLGRGAVEGIYGSLIHGPLLPPEEISSL